MRAVVIPDVHLKPWLFDLAETILENKQADRAVCLMDIADDWDMEFQIGLYEKTYDRAIDFAKQYSNTLWCYGNHDISYVWRRLESGYSPYAERTVISKLDALKKSLKDSSQITFIHRIDNVLFSHGGLTSGFVSRLNKDLLDADMDQVIAAVNDAPQNYLWNDDSPLWLRPQYRKVEAFRKDSYVQVIGHTPVETISEQNGFISTDVFSTYRDGRRIGEPVMIVIDTVADDYEKVEVRTDESRAK